MKKGFFLTFLIVALIFLVHCSNLPVSVYFERNDVAAVKAKENIPRRIEEEVEEIVEVINNSLLVKGSGRFEKGLVAIEGANFTKFVAVDGAGSINGNLLVGGKVDIGGMLIVEEDVVSKDVNLTQLVKKQQEVIQELAEEMKVLKTKLAVLEEENCHSTPFYSSGLSELSE